MDNYMSSLLQNKDSISNVVQGNLWQTKYLNKEKKCFPLVPYWGEFETGNGMGSRAGNQKLGGVFVSMPCLPPNLAFKLQNCMLVTLFYSKDRKLFKNDVIFSELIENLNILSRQGLTIAVNGEEKTIYFQCPFFAGDNLAQNGACGFNESFSAKYWCRICRADSDTCKLLTSENPKLLRTIDNYESDVINKACGVKERCVFNELDNFDIAVNRSLDKMHDGPEGVEHYTVEHVLNDVIYKKKIISLAEVNKRIEEFPYGSLENSNKPSSIRKDYSSNKIILKQSAAQMSCLTRYLNLMIGDIMESHKYRGWRVYQLLRNIKGVIDRPSFVKSELLTLRDTISEFCREYIRNFSYLPPKGHLYTHIPTVMADNGPLDGFSAMPFERKNKELKELANTTCCRKNVLKSIAIRSQLKLAYTKEFTDDISESITLGTLKTNPTNLKLIIDSITPGIISSEESKLQSNSFVEINGYKYCEGSIFVKEIDQEPNFAYLSNIFKINDVVYFLGYSYALEYYSEFYHAYKVTTSETPDSIVMINKMPHVPPALVVSKKGDLYITTRFD